MIGPLKVNSDNGNVFKNCYTLVKLVKTNKDQQRASVTEPYFSSHAHEMLKVSYSDQSMSIVCDASSTICFK